MITALVSILILGFLVIVHELGHFVVARWAGVRILRLSIGFGPRVLTWTRGHTEYAISAIPLGGYVKMAGEQHAEQSHLPTAPNATQAGAVQAGEPWEYLSKSISKRAGIVFAGPFVNYLVAFISLWAVFVIGYPELLPVVGKVMSGMPAQAAGFQPGDRIRAIDRHPVPTWEEMTKFIYDAPNRPLVFHIERHGLRQTLTVTPAPKLMPDPLGRPKTVGLIGISASGEFQSYRVGPVTAVVKTVKQQLEFIGQTLLGLFLMATGKLSMRESVTGPIGIISVISEGMRLGLAPFLSRISLLSLSLAFFNLFPIPILDGGHLFFLCIEKLRGTPVSINVQERSAQVSLVLLVALILMVCANDVSRFGIVDKVVGWVHR